MFLSRTCLPTNMDVDLRPVFLEFLIKNALMIATITLLSFLILRPLFDSKRRRLPPGPTGLPLLGYMPFMARNNTDTFMQLFSRYGKIFSLRLGLTDVVFISDFEVLKRISKLDVFNYRPEFSFFTLVFPASMGSCR